MVKRHRSARVPGLVIIAALALAACGASPATTGTPPPAAPGASADGDPGGGGGDSASVPASAAPMTGLASACPTLAEAQAAIASIQAGPEAKGTATGDQGAFEMLQCGYDVSGGGWVGALVFDASAYGLAFWDDVRGNPAYPHQADVPKLRDVADIAFSAGSLGDYTLFAIEDMYGVKVAFLDASLSVDDLTALAHTLLAHLSPMVPQDD
jgi:hypothetical protein